MGAREQLRAERRPETLAGSRERLLSQAPFSGLSLDCFLKGPVREVLPLPHCADEETEAQRGLSPAQDGLGSRPLLRASRSPALWEAVGSGSKPTLRSAGGLECGDPLEKEMAIHSSTIAWKIPWTQEPGRLQSMGLQRVRHN